MFGLTKDQLMKIGNSNTKRKSVSMESLEKPIKIENQYFPSLFLATDQISNKAQFSHLILIKSYLATLVMGSFLALFLSKSDVSSIIITLVFLVALGLLIFKNVKRYDRIWFSCRAVAESIKTRSWRYMMRAEPYLDSSDVKKVRSEFRFNLKQIISQKIDSNVHLGSDYLNKEVVTSSMNEIRKLDLQERIQVYKNDRILDQLNWYLKKAKLNSNLASRWFFALIFLHLAIIVMLLFSIKYPEWKFPIDFLVVVASSVLSWTQARKYQDLSNTYTLAASEIGLINEESELVITEEDFSDFVINSENAFSREHTQWVARKNTQ